MSVVKESCVCLRSGLLQQPVRKAAFNRFKFCYVARKCDEAQPDR
jgi:hypothetical protein